MFVLFFFSFLSFALLFLGFTGLRGIGGFDVRRRCLRGQRGGKAEFREKDEVFAMFLT